jgi:Domain of unknown function (DUF4258)
MRQARYRFSLHALEEMAEDDLMESDVYRVIMRGKLVAKFTDDRRGTRFIVRGLATDNEKEVETVCRFLPSGILRIITVYVIEE